MALAQFQELIPFLRDKNPQVRQISLQTLLAQTVPGAAHRDIFFSSLQSGGLQKQQESNVIRDLKLLCRDQLSTAHDAFRALVNLSDSPLMITPLSEPAFIDFITSYIIVGPFLYHPSSYSDGESMKNPHSILAELASMLLSNLTATATPCSIVLSMKIKVIIDSRLSNSFYPVNSQCGSCPAPVPYPSGEVKEVAALPLLIDAFIEGAQLTDDLSKRTRKAELHFLSNVFANMTMSPIGRKYFLSPQPVNLAKPDALEFPLAKIVVFTEHSNSIRRSGTASTIKNCAFDTPGHKAILSPESTQISVPPSTANAPGVDALPYILLPLAGPEEYDLDDQEKLLEQLQLLPSTKKREPDASIRLTHIETLLLLCHTRWGRDYQRQHGVYQIIRTAHEKETVDKISGHIERLVQLIHGEEPKEPLPEVELEDYGQKRADDITPATDEESDDEDFKIEEI